MELGWRRGVDTDGGCGRGGGEVDERGVAAVVG